MKRLAFLSRICLTALSLAVAAAPLRAQDELSVIKAATEREQAGDFAGAHLILEKLLRQNPQSLSGLLALERVSRMEGRLGDLIPIVELHLKTDPSSAIGHQMLVRALSSLDQVADLEKAADAWVRMTPRIETPYREVARVFQARSDYSKALQYLRLGRSRVGRADALALELGDVYALLQEYDRAVREWDRAIGPDARGLLLVQRRLSAMRDGGAQMLPSLVDALMRPPASLPRQRAAAQLAIDAGLEQRAERVVRQTAARLAGPERQAFLVEAARRADAAELPRVALWAYSQLTPADLQPDQMLAVRARVAELALAVGDTASAARSYQELERSVGPGAPQRRQAVALRIQLIVKEARLADAETRLAVFEREFPNAPELDPLAAALANAYLEKDQTDQAEGVLTGVTGARSSIARGRIALRRGDVAAARNAFLTAAPSLQGAEATETIKLVSMLGKVSKQGGELLGKSIARASTGATREAFTLLEKGAQQLPEPERPSVLEFAAAMADRAQMPLAAERARRAIVSDFPRSAEAPAAILALARNLAERGDAFEEARQYLERLIVEYPRSALVPQARQELDRLQERIPRS